MAAEAITLANGFREAGKRHFQAEDYKAALVEYHKIYMYVHGYSKSTGSSAGMMESLRGGASKQPEVTAEEMAQLRELKLVHFSNVGACHFRLSNFAKCAVNCTKALELEPDNVKCLFRRGRSYLELDDLDAARVDLLRVQRLEPQNRELAAPLRELKIKSAAHDREEAKKYKRIFERMSTDPKNHAEPAAAPAAATAVAGDESRQAIATTDGMAVLALEAEASANGHDDIGEPLGPPEAFTPSTS